MTSIPTSAQRFAAHALLISLGRNGAASGKTARALRLAQQWDGFPDSYHSTQIETGRELIIAVSQPDDDTFIDCIDSVLELESARQNPKG